jgi:integrase
MGKLTKTGIDRLPAGMHGDGDGLWLQVKEGKDRIRKSWLFRYRAPDGKQRAMGLGAYPDVSLVDARAMAHSQRQLTAKGIDPIDHRDGARRKAEDAITYAMAAERYVERMSSKWCLERTRKFLPEQKRHVFPHIGSIPVDAVDTRDVLKVISPRWDTHPSQAIDILSLMRSVLNFARANGWSNPDKPNPAEWKGNLEHLLAPSTMMEKRINRPGATWRDVPEIIARLRELGTQMQHSPVGLRHVAVQIIEFQILTATRPSEAREAPWSEIDLDARVWTIPPERMKAGRVHRVPLSEPAVRLLRARPRLGEYVFPQHWSMKWVDKPLNLITQRAPLLSLGYVDENRRPITLHGFRSSFTMFAKEATSYSSDIIKLALAHSIMTRTEAAYYRGDHLEQRRPLMEDWGRVCMGEWTTGDVVPIRGRSA